MKIHYTVCIICDASVRQDFSFLKYVLSRFLLSLFSLFLSWFLRSLFSLFLSRFLLCLFSFLAPFPRTAEGVKRRRREARKEKEEVQLKKWEAEVVFPQPIFWHILPSVLVPTSKHRDLEARLRNTETDIQEKDLYLRNNIYIFFYISTVTYMTLNVWSAGFSLMKLSFPYTVINNRKKKEKKQLLKSRQFVLMDSYYWTYWEYASWYNRLL